LHCQLALRASRNQLQAWSDGDLDFVELGADAFAIHVNLGSDQFGPPLQLPASLSRDAERPFLQIGTAMAVLTATREDAIPTFQTLEAE
jgi:hypothetical protein